MHTEFPKQIISPSFKYFNARSQTSSLWKISFYFIVLLEAGIKVCCNRWVTWHFQTHPDQSKSAQEDKVLHVKQWCRGSRYSGQRKESHRQSHIHLWAPEGKYWSSIKSGQQKKKAADSQNLRFVRRQLHKWNNSQEGGWGGGGRGGAGETEEGQIHSRKAACPSRSLILVMLVMWRVKMPQLILTIRNEDGTFETNIFLSLRIENYVAGLLGLYHIQVGWVV